MSATSLEVALRVKIPSPLLVRLAGTVHVSGAPLTLKVTVQLWVAPLGVQVVVAASIAAVEASVLGTGYALV